MRRSRDFERALLHAAVGEDAARAWFSRVHIQQAVVGFLDGGHHHRAAAGGQAVERTLDGDGVAGRLHRRGPALGSVELDDAGLVVRLQALEREAGDLLGEVHALGRPSSRRCR